MIIIIINKVYHDEIFNTAKLLCVIVKVISIELWSNGIET